MSAWKWRTSFAPTQGLHIIGYVPSKHRYCHSHISSYEWKIWIITTRQLRDYVTLFFPYFHIHISLKLWKLILDNTFHKLLKCQPRWLSGLRRSLVHSLMVARHCVRRNWDQIPGRAVKGLISRAGMVSICPLLWPRDVKLQQTSYWNANLVLEQNSSFVFRRS